MKTRTTHHSADLPRSFDELNALHPLRPINDDIDLGNAQEIVDHLAIMDQRTKDQRDYLETLSTLIEKYETEHSRIDISHVDPIDTLKFLLQGHGMNASDLGRLLGERTLGPAILRGDRELSKAHIRTLCRHFGVVPGTFFRV